MKIQSAEVIQKENLFNNNIYFIKYQNHKVALYRENKLFVLNKDNSFKEIPYEESNVFSWYTDYMRNSDIQQFMKVDNIEDLHKKALQEVLALRPKYSAGFLNDEDKKKLLDKYSAHIPESWNVVCHHMTMHLGRLKEEQYNLRGITKEATVTHVGVLEDLVVAFKIETDIPSVNEHKHITLALSEKGKPFMSNKIEDWKKVELLEVDLKIGEFLNNETVNYGKEKPKKKIKVKY